MHRTFHRTWRWPWDPKIPKGGWVPAHRSFRPTYSGYMPELIGWGILLGLLALIGGILIVLFSR